jgi:GDP/UDP-N,N'-diacetylbacillosamine 2-epimerase (hydrolysing)
MKKKICLITTNRADYGLQKNLISILRSSKKIDFKIIATGAHLEKKFGYSINEILEDKNKVNFKFREVPKKDNSLSTLLSMSGSLKKFSIILNKAKPDTVVILGDRYEMLSAAIACMIQNFTIAHLYGGEVTEGSFDNEIRNAISKLASLHFVSHHSHKSRLINMGENPKNIFDVGGLGAENIRSMTLHSKKILEKKFNINLEKKNILVAFHPVTKEPSKTTKYFMALVSATKKFRDINFIFSYPNPDPENNQIIEILKKEKINKNFYIIKSFGQKYFFSLLNNINGIIGNSSSGILEAPSFKIGTLNIGKRQEGRIQSKSIINCLPETKAIELGIKKILSNSFSKKLKKVKNIYYKKNTAMQIARVLINSPKKTNQ